MKRKIRRGVWESNSSTEHVFSILMKDDYDRWKHEGNIYLYCYNYDYCWGDSDIKPIKYGIYTKQEVINFIKKSKWFSEDEFNQYDEDDIDYYFKENGFISYDLYNDMDISDDFYEEYTTSNGDTIVAFGGLIYD